MALVLIALAVVLRKPLLAAALLPLSMVAAGLAGLVVAAMTPGGSVNYWVKAVLAKPRVAWVELPQAVAGSRYAGRPLARIRARTLVLHGGADAVVDPRNGRLLAARIPGARLVTFPGLGHLLFWEDPDGFAAAVASFLLGLRPRS